MKTRALILAGLFVLALAAVWAAQQTQSRPEIGTQEAMRLKLGYSEKVLEGISLENYGMIKTNAQRLVALSRLAGWRARQTPEYELFSNEFRRQAEGLVIAANEKNLDAATIAYVQLTFSCTACHKYMRGAKVAGIVPLPDTRPDPIPRPL